MKHRRDSEFKRVSMRLASATVVAAAATLTIAGAASAGENPDADTTGSGSNSADHHQVDGSGPYPSLVEGVLGGVGGALHGVLGDDVLHHILSGIV